MLSNKSDSISVSNWIRIQNLNIKNEEILFYHNFYCRLILGYSYTSNTNIKINYSKIELIISVLVI